MPAGGSTSGASSAWISRSRRSIAARRVSNVAAGFSSDIGTPRA
jgi:hypothetical protein